MLGTPIGRKIWTFPEARLIEGVCVTLEPLSLTHLDDLWAAAAAFPQSFEYLRYGPFQTKDALRELILDLSTRKHQPFWAVQDGSGKAHGWLSICDVSVTDGAFEIGSIWFSLDLQGTRAAREAIFLLMSLGMDTYEYERLVWRCQVQNAQSFKAALNLGFQHEGTWRNAAVVKGFQRDVAWFSILQSEWPLRRRAFEAWLSDENFESGMRQKKRLGKILAGLV